MTHITILLVGISFIDCGKDEPTEVEPTSEPTSEPAGEPSQELINHPILKLAGGDVIFTETMSTQSSVTAQITDDGLMETVT